ncbi:MAG: hypothetical protein RIQ89_764 [Bacteroidota bacterium]|jgi:ElaA protein
MIEIKTFDSLTPHQLYGIAALRQEVFIVEQQCLFNDLDHKDQQAIHLLYYLNGNISGVARILYLDKVSIGRIVVAKPYRNQGVAAALINAAMDYCKLSLNAFKIHLFAQAHLVKYYNKFGFTAVGNEFLEDGIPHQEMYYLAKSIAGSSQKS